MQKGKYYYSMVVFLLAVAKSYAIRCYQGKDLPLLLVLASFVASMLFYYRSDQAFGAVLNEDPDLYRTSKLNMWHQ